MCLAVLQHPSVLDLNRIDMRQDMIVHSTNPTGHPAAPSARKTAMQRVLVAALDVDQGRDLQRDRKPEPQYWIRPGRHTGNDLRHVAVGEHDRNDDQSLTLNQELKTEEYDEAQAVNVELEAGCISLHDVYLAHGSEVNNSDRPRRGMTLRLMPTTSHFDRDLAEQMFRERGGRGLGAHNLFLLRGGDACGRNDYRIRT